MANSGSLERALEELIQRALDNRLASLQQELRSEITNAMARMSKGEGGGAAAAPALAALNQSVSRILQPTGQSEIMTAFLKGAAECSGRCALFVKRGDNFSFWRAEGFTAQGAKSLSSATIPSGDAGCFQDIVSSRRAFIGQRSGGNLPAALNKAVGKSADENLCLLPVVVRGRVVAALYADAGTVAGSAEPSALEILAQVAGLSLETAPARQSARTAPAAGEGAPAAEPGAASPAAAADEAVAKEATQEAAPLLETPEEVPAGEQGPPPGSFAASIPTAGEGEAALPPPPDTSSLSKEEKNAHKKAHRFARVAVQDLLSYHKGKIEEGRKNKNAYMAVKEDIDKTRQNYQKRFGETAARSFDYLHYELVLKLAGNDPSVLGDQYPGPFDGE